MDIREEDPLSDDIASQNETEFFTKIDTLKTNSDAVLLDLHCDMAIKTETYFPQFCSQTERGCFIKQLVKQIKNETITSSDNCEIDEKKETVTQTLVYNLRSLNKREFQSEDPVMKVKECNSDQEMDNKIEIKEEPLWLETETSSVCDIKDGDFPPVKFSRLCMHSVSSDSHGKSPLPSSEVSGRNKNSYSRKYPEHGSPGNEVTEIPSVEHVVLEQSDECSDGEMYSRALYPKQKNMCSKDKRPHTCKTCQKSFTYLSHLKRHTEVHEGKLYQCIVCDKRFTRLSTLKIHNLNHEGKRPYQCMICNKRFTLKTTLKTHNLINEDKKLQCIVCNKIFTVLSHLMSHNLIHEGKKLHQCIVCDKRFTQLYALKTQNLIHEGKKPHQCIVCDKRFTQWSNMKTHSLTHKGKKPHKCEICDKRFTVLSALKAHNLIHEGKKPHQCTVCNKRFTQLSHLKSHNLIHEGKKLHQCIVCDKKFTQLSTLKRQKLTHDGKNPHKRIICD